MRKIQYVLVLAIIAIFATGCADSYLDQNPSGSTITEAQYYNMDNVAEGTVKGVYTLLYEYGGDHDVFGQRSIDMYGDLLCGDMALNTFNYGWFRTDELMQTYTRRAYFWSYYYTIIRNCNKAINVLDAQSHPLLDFDLETITTEEYYNGFYYAELLAIRGWAYAGLSRYFVEVGADETSLSVPIYTEADTKADTIIGGPRATVGDLYLRIEEDLQTAIQYFGAYNLIARNSKIEINQTVARILLAYSYLNKGDYTSALAYAEEAISYSVPAILPLAEVLTTGFNNVENANWLWGEDVTVENSTGLASFFGQCDIYSYSYASAGDVKAIDKALYEEIQPWDIRQYWWNNYGTSKARDAKEYEYAPDGKFYSAKSTTLQGDRDWLSDNVYMRWELAYLIAAEASARNHNVENAKSYLFAITDERVIPDHEDAYEAWKESLTDEMTVLAAIKHNWRVELWGEGYGLQTFRRYGESVNLGENHKRSEKTITPGTPRRFTFEIPNSEQFYNPAIRDAMDTKSLRKKN